MSCCDAVIYELSDKDFSNDGKSLRVRSPYMLVLFKMKGCPHCEHFSTWEKLATTYRRNICACFSEVEIRREMSQKFVIFMAFRLFAYITTENNTMIEYHGDRLYKDLEKFLDKYIS